MEAQVKRGRGRPAGSKDKVKRARRGKKGEVKEAVKEAILEGEIPNEYQAAFDFVLAKAEKMGLKKV
jgi:hypothetical protein